jgi:RNA polymerase sigma-70 factor (ECF subfamily)
MSGFIVPGLVAAASAWGRDAPVVESAESTLVGRLRRGEPQAIALAYDQHHVRVRAFARRLVGEAAAAEDLVQEVFVTLPGAIRRFREESSLATFLTALAINHARHHVRAATRRRRALERLAAEPAPPGPVSSPEQRASSQELAAALGRALDRLPLEQRVAFVLLEVEERTSTEAAALLEVPEATVRTRLFHARRKLRELLGAEGHHDPR